MNPPVLPLKANEAAALADLVYSQLEGKALTPESLAQFGSQVAALGLATFTPHTETLMRDHASYFLEIDTSTGKKMLHIGMASDEPSPDEVVVGRMRPGGGREIVIGVRPL